MEIDDAMGGIDLADRILRVLEDFLEVFWTELMEFRVEAHEMGIEGPLPDQGLDISGRFGFIRLMALF